MSVKFGAKGFEVVTDTPHVREGLAKVELGYIAWRLRRSGKFRSKLVEA